VYTVAVPSVVIVGDPVVLLITAAALPLEKGRNVQVFVPFFTRVAALNCASVNGVPLMVTPTAPATVTVPAPTLSSRSCVPVGHATDDSSGNVTATGLAFDVVTSLVKSVSTKLYVVPVCAFCVIASSGTCPSTYCAISSDFAGYADTRSLDKTYGSPMT
jgi:hypothetical protein